MEAVTPGDSACHSARLGPSIGLSHHLSALNMRALRAGVSAVNNRHSLPSNSSKKLPGTDTRLPVRDLQNNTSEDKYKILKVTTDNVHDNTKYHMFEIRRYGLNLESL